MFHTTALAYYTTLPRLIGKPWKLLI